MPKHSRKIKREQTFKESINYEKNKELYWVLAGMLVILAVLLVSSSIFRSFNHFTYKGLSFTKEKFGEIPVYHYYYYFTNESSKQQYQYNLYLRDDPRKNNVSVQGNIEYPYGNTIYVSINGTDLTGCPMASRDIGTLSAFLVNNLLPIKAGTPNREEAKASNLTYIDCSTNPNNVVIKIQSGSETKITEQNNCYIISISNCQTTDAIEKFEVQSILDAKARAKAIQS